MSTVPTNTGVKRDAMTEYYDFAKRLAMTIGQEAAERRISTEDMARLALADGELRAKLRFSSLQGSEAERISPQDTTNIVNCVASGELKV